jgi:hypothetical protein
VRRWRHLPLRRPAPGGLAASRGPQRCDIVTVRTATMSHRCGWRSCHRRRRSAAGGAAGACAAGGVRAEPPPGRPGARRPAAHSEGATPLGHPRRKHGQSACTTSHGSVRGAQQHQGRNAQAPGPVLGSPGGRSPSSLARYYRQRSPLVPSVCPTIYIQCRFPAVPGR